MIMEFWRNQETIKPNTVTTYKLKTKKEKKEAEQRYEVPADEASFTSSTYF